MKYYNRILTLIIIFTALYFTSCSEDYDYETDYSNVSRYISVVANEGGTAQISKTKVNYNGEVTFTATPEESYRFVNWSVNGERISSINPLVINVTSDMEVVAKFNKKITQPLKILAIGNSWSNNATIYLNEILKDLGVESTIYTAIKGSGKLEDCYYNILNNTKDYSIVINGKYDKEFANSYSISEILDIDDFDIITLQQQSGNAGIYNTYQPYLNSVIKFIESKETNDPIIYFHSTWSYPKGCNHFDFNKYKNNSYIMYFSIMSTWRKAIKDEGIDKIIPSTYTVQKVREIEGIYDIDKPDGKHLSSNGCFAVGCVWAETFIRELGLNKTIFELNYNPTSLSNSHFNLIKNIAFTAVERREIDYGI
ncbi:MAG: DUF4886 domain-containing protein [Muribaculaceae bacterium]|nr:DUF4886 domain-containing protein [Muribaculaceae bacterium]